MPTELSAHNPRIQRVRDLHTPPGRRAARQFIAEGPVLLEEAARSGMSPRELYVTVGGLRRFEAGPLEARGVPVYLVPDRVFERLSDLETPTGVLGVFDLPGHTAAAVIERRGPVLVLAGVSDPGNAGTLVRSAEAFGAAGVLFGRGGVEPYSPKVVRGAMGSLFRLPIAQVDPHELLALAEAAGRPVIAADVEGEDVTSVDLPRNAVFAVGNERRGVRDWLPRWDRAVRIPQGKATESLNAAVAGSIVLYEAARVK